MIKTMLQRLLGHLHRAVFDTSTDDVVAFKLNGPAGSYWIAKDEMFDVFVPSTSTQYSFDLNNYTMVEFMDQLTKIGMTVTDVNPDTRYFSGITMLELSGSAGSSPSDIVLYKDILHAIFGAYSREVRAVKDAVDEGINQMYIPTADDGFLDTWGQTFGIPRDGRDDNDYRQYIISEIFRVRVNTYAIEKTVFDLTKYEIQLKEPWRDIFRLDTSHLSGGDRLYDGLDTGYFIVQPTSFKNVDWDVVIPIIKRNLAAGISVLKPTTSGVFYVNDPLDGTIWWQAWSMYGTWVLTDQMARLDDSLVLSGELITQYNYSVAITSLQSLTNFGYPVAGIVNWTPSRLQSFYAEEGTFPIGEWHTGTYQGAFLQMYPTDPRTWMTGGWDPDATWTKPYEVKIYASSVSLENKFFADASGVGVSVSITPTSGQTWDDEPEWNDDTWQGRGGQMFIAFRDQAATGTNPQVTAPFGWIAEGYQSLELPLSGGVFKIICSKYSAFDTTVSRGTQNATFTNSDDTVASVATLPGNNYTFNVTPKAAGQTTLFVTTPDGDAIGVLYINVK
ncbi:hypothetical protein IAJ44_004286 [Salmonella enterica]|nr:hypothetical protein [Salmonella enterica]